MATRTKFIADLRKAAKEKNQGAKKDGDRQYQIFSNALDKYLNDRVQQRKKQHPGASSKQSTKFGDISSNDNATGRKIFTESNDTSPSIPHLDSGIKPLSSSTKSFNKTNENPSFDNPGNTSDGGKGTEILNKSNDSSTSAPKLDPGMKPLSSSTQSSDRVNVASDGASFDKSVGTSHGAKEAEILKESNDSSTSAPNLDSGMKPSSSSNQSFDRETTASGDDTDLLDNTMETELLNKSHDLSTSAPNLDTGMNQSFDRVNIDSTRVSCDDTDLLDNTMETELLNKSHDLSTSASTFELGMKVSSSIMSSLDGLNQDSAGASCKKTGSITDVGTESEILDSISGTSDLNPSFDSGNGTLSSSSSKSLEVSVESPSISSVNKESMDEHEVSISNSDLSSLASSQTLSISLGATSSFDKTASFDGSDSSECFTIFTPKLGKHQPYRRNLLQSGLLDQQDSSLEDLAVPFFGEIQSLNVADTPFILDSGEVSNVLIEEIVGEEGNDGSLTENEEIGNLVGNRSPQRDEAPLSPATADQSGNDSNYSDVEMAQDRENVRNQNDDESNSDVEMVQAGQNLKKRTRKRKVQPALWKRNIVKAKRNSGVEYHDSKGNLRPARVMGDPCDESCRKKCFEKVTQEQRQALFKEYWACADNRSKWGFIARQVKAKPKQSGENSESSKRVNSRDYSFRLSKTEEVKVCKTMFLSTLGICDAPVTTALNKLGDGAHISPDKRGAHTSGGKKVNPKIKESVKEHIEGFPRQPSHYIRDSSTREYLIDDVQGVSELHEAYTDWMKTNHPLDPVATYRQYLDVFNYEYNIGFFISKKDMCDDCVAYENASEEEKEKMEVTYRQHISNKDVAQDLRRADHKFARLKENKNVCVADFDYEKSLNSPKSKASIFYYKRKLRVYNFTIVDAGKREDFCYVYDETIGGKGSNEVGSFLTLFVELKVKEGATKIILHCDNCTGQNKNRGVISSLLVLAAKYNIIIILRYLEKGHTWNSADTVHSTIEGKTRPHNIYIPREWYDRISKAKRKKNPMKVIEVTQDMIKDWKDLAGKLQLDKNVDNERIPWMSIREFQFGGEETHCFSYKTEFHEDAKIVSTKGVGRPVNLEIFQPQRAYDKPLPIAKAKYKDLKYYCDHNLIPQQFHDFYLSLPHADIENEAADVELPLEEPRPAAGRGRKRRAVKPKAPRKKRARLQPEAHSSSEDEPAELPAPANRRGRTRRGAVEPNAPNEAEPNGSSGNESQ